MRGRDQRNGGEIAEIAGRSPAYRRSISEQFSMSVPSAGVCRTLTVSQVPPGPRNRAVSKSGLPSNVWFRFEERSERNVSVCVCVHTRVRAHSCTCAVYKHHDAVKETGLERKAGPGSSLGEGHKGRHVSLLFVAEMQHLGWPPRQDSGSLSSEFWTLGEAPASSVQER